MRYFIHLAYVGTHYRGWQRQTSTDQSIQELIENTMAKMTGQHRSIMGCGRTDSGVHAIQYFAHFDFDGEWMYDPVARINKMLPDDIVVYDIIPLHDGANARFDAIGRTYEYHIHLERNPFLSQTSTYFQIDIPNLELVKQALILIKNQQDFRYFCLTPDRHKHTFCHIFEAEWVQISENTRFYIRFKANRFLKSMIRIIVARLMDLAANKITLDEFVQIMNGEKELKYNRLAPPNGLHLSKVEYPYLDIEPKI